MRIEDLKVFADVVRYHSINIAAEKNYMTSQNVSKIIKNMENELGTLLLQRSTKGSNVTDVGEQFYLGVLKVLKEYEEAVNCLLSSKNSIINLDNTPKLEIKVLSSEGATNYAILNAYNVMKKRKIDFLLDVNVRAELSSEIKNEIRNETYDLLVLGIQTAHTAELMDICRNYIPMYVVHDEMVLLTSKQHPLANRAMILVEELNNLEFLLHQASYAHRDFPEVSLNCFMKLNSLYAITDLIAKSVNYCTIASKSLVKLYNKQNANSDLSVISIDKKIESAFYIMVKKELNNQEMIQEFCREIYNNF